MPPSFKLQRANAKKHYARQIDAMYGELAAAAPPAGGS